MAKQTPKYIIQKIERMNALMEKIVELNFELEEWMEGNGIEDGFGATFDYRDDRGYGIIDTDAFIDMLNDQIV